MECGYSARPSGVMSSQALYKSTTGYYDADNMGRDSPGVPLLDMLAEVASQTLHSEKNQDESTMTSPKKKKVDTSERKNHEVSYTLQQLLTMPATQLLKQFTIFHSEELKKQYSYTCALVSDCGQKYTSFASEIRARMSIKSHIIEHLDFFKNNPETVPTFIPLTTKYRKSKTTLCNKKVKKEMQVKKPLENLNKENKEVKGEKCTSYLRKILSNEVNSKEYEKEKVQEMASRVQEIVDVKEDIKSESNEAKFLGDHSYFEHIKDENEIESATEETNNTIVDGIIEENIMLMVVESDGVHVKELPYIVQKVSNEDKINHNANKDSPDLTKSMEVAVETVTQAKPKGKAKFIGTSKEEREMALALMELIKKKGNPSGSNLQCRICDPPRSFTAPTTLVSHYRSHAGIKPYECRICRAVFTRRHSLKYHMLIHQNQTRFTCADCEKKFRHPSHFREHRRRHTGEAPFGCDDCGQRFKTRNTYKRHLKTRHGKVLTTSGELLCLSEEDFQKVKTNRRKKFEASTESVIANESSIATNTIVQYQKTDQVDMLKDVSCDTQDINDNGAVWMNYCGYESANESHADKTEFLKTEEELDTNAVKQTYDFNEEGATNLQIMHSDILYNDEPLYSVDSINEYMDVNYEDFVNKKQKDQDEQEEAEGQGLQLEEDSCSKEFNDRYSECIKNLETQNETSISYLEEGMSFEGQEDQTQDETEENNKDTMNDTLKLSQNLQPDDKLETEATIAPTLTEINDTVTPSSEEKGVKILPQIKILESQNTPTLQLLKKGKVTILGKAGQILNLSQNGKQSAILLLSTADPKVMKFLKINTSNGEALKSVAVTQK